MTRLHNNSPATNKQVDYLKKLIREIEPEMRIPDNMTVIQAGRRIQWLLKKKANPKITRKLYMS